MIKKWIVIGAIISVLAGVGIGFAITGDKSSSLMVNQTLEGTPKSVKPTTGNGTESKQNEKEQSMGAMNKTSLTLKDEEEDNDGAMNTMNSLVDMNSAINIFFKHVPGVRVHSVSYEIEGRKHYEIEGYSDARKETAKVDAMTGEIYEWESEKYSGPLAHLLFDPTAIISVEQALLSGREKLGKGYTLMDWSITAENGEVTYKLDLLRKGIKKEVYVNALNGFVKRVEND